MVHTRGSFFSLPHRTSSTEGDLDVWTRFTHALFRAGSCPPDTVPWSLFLRMQIYPAGWALRRLGFAPLAPKQIWNCDRGRSWETGLVNSDEEASQPLGRTKEEPHREGSWLDQRSGMPRVSQHALQLGWTWEPLQPLWACADPLPAKETHTNHWTERSEKTAVKTSSTSVSHIHRSLNLRPRPYQAPTPISRGI